ncbi:MAG: hypothetical protein ACK50A_14565 [Sphingobacteriaceae bacterium]|jgi:lipopolysaccharide export LptBFGC system permease protein LptF
MDAFIEILKIILPAGVVFAAVYFVIKSFLKAEQTKRDHELKKANQSTVLPLKIQAYERLIIYLERINPNTLVIRTNKNGMSSQQLQLELIKAIRTEYEHNLSQQIYVTHGSWELVKNAKEELIKLINISSTKVSPEGPSNELAMMVLNVAAGLDKKLPSEIAIEFIKKEVAKIF